MRDNSRANHSCFKIYQKNYGSDEIFAWNHFILKEVLIFLYWLNNPMHLLKNVRSKGQTEKIQKLKLKEPETQ